MPGALTAALATMRLRQRAFGVTGLGVDGSKSKPLLHVLDLAAMGAALAFGVVLDSLHQHTLLHPEQVQLPRFTRLSSHTYSFFFGPRHGLQ
jgi:hypothetical protein